MKIKLDENLPSELVPTLVARGHDVHSVFDEGMVGARDVEVWKAAQREQRFLITQDMDFSDIRRLGSEDHAGVLLLRLHNPTWRALMKRVDWLFHNEDVTSWQNCLVVATDRKVRIRPRL